MMWNFGEQITCVGGRYIGDEPYFGTGIVAPRERLKLLPQDDGSATYFFGKNYIIPRRVTTVSQTRVTRVSDKPKPITYFCSSADSSAGRALEQKERLRKPRGNSLTKIGSIFVT